MKNVSWVGKRKIEAEKFYLQNCSCTFPAFNNNKYVSIDENVHRSQFYCYNCIQLKSFIAGSEELQTNDISLWTE
jgi:hypothetical protein